MSDNKTGNEQQLGNEDSEHCSDNQLEGDSNDCPGEVVRNTIGTELRLGNDGTLAGSSVETVSQVGKNDKVTQSCSGVQLTVVNGDEPYVGQEFESLAAAHAFYNAYGMRLGFITRINYNTRSKRDGSVIYQSFVCNKEGYRRPSGNEVKSIRARAPTRVGCKAMISVRKMISGKWVVRKFVKEHTHILTGGQAPRTVFYNQTEDEDRRVQDLTQQLLIERKRSASLRKCIDLLFNHIEEHTEDLSKKIQYIVDTVNKIESEGKPNQGSR